MKHRICAEAQGDGVPCMSVRVACDECVRARPIRKRLRRRAKAVDATAASDPNASATAQSSQDDPR